MYLTKLIERNLYFFVTDFNLTHIIQMRMWGMLMTLEHLDIGKEAEIISLDTSENMKKRLLDLGLVPGTKIKPVLSSGKKEFVAYMVRRTLIAIRKEDAKKIMVREIYD